MRDNYDLVVIGSGPAGEKGAAQAAYFGKRVCVIEKEPEPGGAGVHTGTLPSKTLRETALFLSGYRQRELYGLRVSLDTKLAVPRLLSRKDTVRDQEVARIRWNLDRHGVKLVRGRARVVDPHAVDVETEDGTARLGAEFILVATGSVPHHPNHIPFEDPDVDDSDTILGIDRLPESLTVLGGGVIGCEYASMFAALGVRVTLVETRGELLSFLDAEISEALRVALVKLGVDVRLRATPGAVRRVGDRIVAIIAPASPPGAGPSETPAGATEIASDKLLYAAGRNGATAGLGLEALGVAITNRGAVEVDHEFRSSVPSIFAAGDVIGFPALASVSMEQARVAVCRAFGFTYKQAVGPILPYGVYTIPEVSCVGLSEEDARAKGTEVVCGKGRYELNTRARIVGDADGFVKLVFERATRRLIGAHFIGERATELVHIGQAVIALGGTVETLIELVFNHPTLSECYKYAAYDALGKWGDGGR
jgi:NAD(P) transhydrogenase